MSFLKKVTNVILMEVFLMRKQELIDTLSYAHDLAYEVEVAENKIPKYEKRAKLWRIIGTSILWFVGSFFVTIVIALMLLPSQTNYDTFFSIYENFYIFYLSFLIPFGYKMFLRHNARKNLRIIVPIYKDNLNSLNAIHSIPDNFKYSGDLYTLHSYLTMGRTDTLKESINLLIKEAREDIFHRETISKLNEVQRENERISSKLDRLD
ncbi:hypothetical protein AF331_16395 [Rossellomorea marisflavi]|uniref:Uncharacterized protein n=2 Tax=Rossellomorea marisflavi TaxID=189381 RepID=A0A0M0G1U6_9BACI|nr:hypothetical protein AF331_16395 [Rossellomorea marisflavi]